MNRFEPPRSSEESIEFCANCGASNGAGDMLYDSRADNYVCDHDCFDEWADGNMDVVSEYYYGMNIE